jgi:hypothetical protein
VTVIVDAVCLRGDSTSKTQSMANERVGLSCWYIGDVHIGRFKVGHVSAVRKAKSS